MQFLGGAKIMLGAVRPSSLLFAVVVLLLTLAPLVVAVALGTPIVAGLLVAIVCLFVGMSPFFLYDGHHTFFSTMVASGLVAGGCVIGLGYVDFGFLYCDFVAIAALLFAAIVGIGGGILAVFFFVPFAIARHMLRLKQEDDEFLLLEPSEKLRVGFWGFTYLLAAVLMGVLCAWAIWHPSYLPELPLLRARFDGLPATVRNVVHLKRPMDAHDAWAFDITPDEFLLWAGEQEWPVEPFDNALQLQWYPDAEPEFIVIASGYFYRWESELHSHWLAYDDVNQRAFIFTYPSD